MCRAFFIPTPPTDQLDHARDLKFGLDDPWDSILGVIEAIFDTSLLRSNVDNSNGDNSISDVGLSIISGLIKIVSALES